MMLDGRGEWWKRTGPVNPLSRAFEVIEFADEVRAPHG